MVSAGWPALMPHKAGHTQGANTSVLLLELRVEVTAETTPGSLERRLPRRCRQGPLTASAHRTIPPEEPLLP